MGYSKIPALAMVAVVVLTVAVGGLGQSTTPSCAQKLVPCANFINSTNPPSSCCEPLKEAVTQEMSCLCGLYNTPGLLASLGINVTEALLLPGRCKISGDLNACVKASAPSPSSSVPPPATPGHDNSGAGKIAWSGVSSVIFVWVSMVMLY